MKRARRLLMVALVGAAVLASATVSSGHRPQARAAGEDSPWPRTDRLPANVRAIKSVVRDLSGRVELMQQSAARYADWEACIRGLPVSEYGDPDRQWGYLYDERNGIGTSYMPALAVDRKSRPRKEDYLFLTLLAQGQLSKQPAPARWNCGAGLRAADGCRQRPCAEADAAGYRPQTRAQGQDHEALCTPPAGGLRALR